MDKKAVEELRKEELLQRLLSHLEEAEADPPDASRREACKRPDCPDCRLYDRRVRDMADARELAQRVRAVLLSTEPEALGASPPLVDVEVLRNRFEWLIANPFHVDCVNEIKRLLAMLPKPEPAILDPEPSEPEPDPGRLSCDRCGGNANIIDKTGPKGSPARKMCVACMAEWDEKREEHFTAFVETKGAACPEALGGAEPTEREKVLYIISPRPPECLPAYECPGSFDDLEWIGRARNATEQGEPLSTEDAAKLDRVYAAVKKDRQRLRPEVPGGPYSQRGDGEGWRFIADANGRHLCGGPFLDEPTAVLLASSWALQREAEASRKLLGEVQIQLTEIEGPGCRAPSCYEATSRLRENVAAHLAKHGGAEC